MWFVASMIDSVDAAAHLGRFLHRLGPFTILERPFFMPALGPAHAETIRRNLRTLHGTMADVCLNFWHDGFCGAQTFLLELGAPHL